MPGSCLLLKPSAIPEIQKAKAVETRKKDSDYPSAKAGLENHQLSQMQPDLSDIRKCSAPDLYHNRHSKTVVSLVLDTSMWSYYGLGECD